MDGGADRDATRLIGSANLVPFACDQAQYSILWRKPEGEIFDVCAQHGIGFLAFSPLAHGALTGKYAAGEQPPAGAAQRILLMNAFMETAGRHYRSDYLLEAVSRLKPIAAGLGLTMSQLGLAWVLRRAEVTSAIIGASRPEQITENVRASGVKLSPEVVAAIDDAVGDVVVWK